MWRFFAVAQSDYRERDANRRNYSMNVKNLIHIGIVNAVNINLLAGCR